MAPSKVGKSRTEDLWEVEPEEGRIDVQIYEASRGETLVQSSTWLTGSTQIDLRRSADRGGGLVNWKTELRVELDPRNPRPLEIELDSGLELIDVLGPAVRGYRTERSGASSRLIVNLDGGLESSIELWFAGPRPGAVGRGVDDSRSAPAQCGLDRWNHDCLPGRIPCLERVPGKSRTACLSFVARFRAG